MVVTSPIGTFRRASAQSRSRGGRGCYGAACVLEGPRRFRIGVIEVSISSSVHGVLDEYGELYRPFEVHQTGQAIELSVYRQQSHWTLGRRYLICGDGERIFTVRRAEALLPHIEWAVNWQIIKRVMPFLQIHAGVMARGATGFIFPAAPGSGKTTLCAGLIAGGWRYLSDEFALVDSAGNLHPYPKALCVKAGSFEVVSRLGLSPFSPRRYKKGRKGRVAYLGSAHLGPQVIGGVCPLRYVVFPTYREGATPRLVPISRGEAVFQLARLSFNLQRFAADGLRRLADTIQQARCFRLLAGDIQATCDLLNRLASEHEFSREPLSA